MGFARGLFELGLVTLVCYIFYRLSQAEQRLSLLETWSLTQKDDTRASRNTSDSFCENNVVEKQNVITPENLDTYQDKLSKFRRKSLDELVQIATERNIPTVTPEGKKKTKTKLIENLLST